MTQEVYAVVYDQGDGSASIHWFRDSETVQELLDNDESYYQNEGEARSYYFPDDFDFKAAGITFRPSKK